MKVIFNTTRVFNKYKLKVVNKIAEEVYRLKNDLPEKNHILRKYLIDGQVDYNLIEFYDDIDHRRIKNYYSHIKTKSWSTSIQNGKYYDSLVCHGWFRPPGYIFPKENIDFNTIFGWKIQVSYTIFDSHHHTTNGNIRNEWWNVGARIIKSEFYNPDVVELINSGISI